ncbi:hypothetical protein Tco_1475421 [Tanacetum coccineum]
MSTLPYCSKKSNPRKKYGSLVSEQEHYYVITSFCDADHAGCQDSRSNKYVGISAQSLGESWLWSSKKPKKLGIQQRGRIHCKVMDAGSNPLDEEISLKDYGFLCNGVSEREQTKLRNQISVLAAASADVPSRTLFIILSFTHCGNKSTYESYALSYDIARAEHLECYICIHNEDGNPRLGQQSNKLIDDSVYKTKVSETETSISKTSKDIVENPKTVWPSAPIIGQWDTDIDNDSVFRPKSDQTKPKFTKINFVKSGVMLKMMMVVAVDDDGLKMMMVVVVDNDGSKKMMGCC